MKCPEDADRTGHKFRCGAVKTIKGQEYVCTRARGHIKSHHAHKNGKCLLVWNVQEDRYFFSRDDVIDTDFMLRVIEGISGHFKYAGKAEEGKVPEKVRCVKGLELIVKG